MAELKQEIRKGGRSMSLQEKTMTCFDCGVTFTFSVEEQESYLAKGYANAPKRCPACRQTRKARQMSAGNYRSIRPSFRSERKLYPATCAQCGKSTQVPFEPKEDRPVFCRDCYNSAKVSR
jgi:CxxC-x17-CxxC domain-containing protein